MSSIPSFDDNSSNKKRMYDLDLELYFLEQLFNMENPKYKVRNRSAYLPELIENAALQLKASLKEQDDIDKVDLILESISSLIRYSDDGLKRVFEQLSTLGYEPIQFQWIIEDLEEKYKEQLSLTVVNFYCSRKILFLSKPKEIKNLLEWCFYSSVRSIDFEDVELGQIVFNITSQRDGSVCIQWTDNGDYDIEFRDEFPSLQDQITALGGTYEHLVGIESTTVLKIDLPQLA